MAPRSILIACLVTVSQLGGCWDRTVNVSEAPIVMVSDTPGRGRTAVEGRLVYIDYEIKLPDGEVILKHKNWRFLVGGNSVVEGLDMAVRGMRPGGRRVVNVPPHKHWGRNGYGDGAIPPNTNLYFHIKLNRVE